MKADIKDADFCVLSHGHYDHSGGFGEYFSANPDKKIYAMKSIVDDYYSASGGTLHSIGVPREVYPRYKENFEFLDDITQLADVTTEQFEQNKDVIKNEI